MTTLDEIKAAIDKLSFDERAKLARWFHNWADDDWDRQMAADAAAGRLDKLLAEVDEDIRNGRIEGMP
jgi:hypothetical protein